MNNKSILIEFPNGRIRHYPIEDFDYYSVSNELEHKEENIIICIDDLSRSFTYELNEQGEIINKEKLCVLHQTC